MSWGLLVLDPIPQTYWLETVLCRELATQSSNLLGFWDCATLAQWVAMSMVVFLCFIQTFHPCLVWIGAIPLFPHHGLASTLAQTHHHHGTAIAIREWMQRSPYPLGMIHGSTSKNRKHASVFFERGGPLQYYILSGHVMKVHGSLGSRSTQFGDQKSDIVAAGTNCQD